MIEIRKATVKDVNSMLDLINIYANKGLMLAKTRYKLFSTVQNFFVAEDTGKVVGCVSISVIWDDLCEICSLAVLEEYKKQGIGRKLINACIDEAKKLEISKIIALTYQDKFFEKLNFKQVDKDRFPRKLWRECLECPKLENCDELAYLYEI